MEQVNIIIGRFQPFTNGHMKCVEEAWKKLHIPTIICMINTPDVKVDKKHPFPSSMLLPIYKDTFKGNKKIKDIILVNNADIVKIGEKLKSINCQARSWTCGTDRIDSYQKMSSKYAEQANLSPDFEMIEVKRGSEDISATKVRKALLNDDEKTFNILTPYNNLKNKLQQKQYYNVFKNYILKIYK